MRSAAMGHAALRQSLHALRGQHVGHLKLRQEMLWAAAGCCTAQGAAPWGSACNVHWHNSMHPKLCA